MQGVVHDNASNTKSIAEKAALPISCDVPCAAHTLQLSINKGLQNVQQIASLVGAANRLVGHFHRSNNASGALKAKQGSMHLPERKLITSCPTRWNSVYDMLVRLQENRWAICAVLSDPTYTKPSDARTFELKEENWALMKYLVRCLKPLQVGL